MIKTGLGEGEGRGAARPATWVQLSRPYIAGCGIGLHCFGALKKNFCMFPSPNRIPCLELGILLNVCIEPKAQVWGQLSLVGG